MIVMRRLAKLAFLMIVALGNGAVKKKCMWMRRRGDSRTRKEGGPRPERRYGGYASV